MAEHLYEVGWSGVAGASSHAIGEIIPATMAAGVRPPEIREIGVTNTTGVAAEIGLGRPAAIGVTPATEVTVQATDSEDTIAGHTVVAQSWGTIPTIPGTFMRRFTLQSIIGAGVIWVWNPGEFRLWSGSAIPTIVLWQLSALSVGYDCYIKVAE